MNSPGQPVAGKLGLAQVALDKFLKLTRFASALSGLLLIAWLVVPLGAQGLGARNTDASSSLQIHVVEGEGVVYPSGGRATRGVTVQVVDESGTPIDGAIVSFLLPQDGPGGTFSTGLRTEIVNTGTDGRAAAWGMQWNHTAGRFEIRITAIKGQARASAVCMQSLTDALAARDTRSSGAGLGHGHKWLWIALAVAGAAGGGVAAASAGGGEKSGAAAASVVTIGTPTITLRHP